MVQDPGSTSNVAGYSGIRYLTNVNGTLYFSIDDGIHGDELWRVNSLGIAEMVEDAEAGGGLNSTGDSTPRFLTSVNGILHFEADDGINGREVWRVNSSGVAELLEDTDPAPGIQVGPLGARLSGAGPLTNLNGVLYFAANDGVNGEELWRVNSAGVAEMVEDSVSGGGIQSYSGSDPRYMTEVNGTVYFSARGGTVGRELWRIDSSGIAELVEDNVPGGGINPTYEAAYPSSLTNVNGTLYFTADDGSNGRELWKVNSSGIAELVEDAHPGNGILPAESSAPSLLMNVNGRLYFRADDGVNGEELWIVNSLGTAEMIEDSIPGDGINDASAGANLSNLINVNGLLYFSGNDGVNGQELWVIDHTRVPRLVEDSIPGSGISIDAEGSFPAGLTNVSGTLYFHAYSEATGRELWRINSQGMAEVVEDTVPGGGLLPDTLGSNPASPINVNGTLYFLANESLYGRELWRINSEGIAEIVDDAVPGGGINSSPYAPSSPSNLTNVNGTLYFRASDGVNGFELWRVNSSGLAEMIEDEIPGGGISAAGNSNPSFMTEVNGAVFFAASNGTSGLELWRINETGNAVLVEDEIPGGGIEPGSAQSNPRYLTNVNGTLYFAATNTANGRELWRINSSGTAELVEDENPGGGIHASGSSNPNSLTRIGNALYFAATDNSEDRELWRINSLGIAERVEDSVAGGGIGNSFSSSPGNFFNLNGTLFFTANEGSGSNELWRLNSAGIAEMVEDTVPGGGINLFGGSNPGAFADINGRLYFSADDGVNGTELWNVRSDGLAAMIDDAFPGGGIAPGVASSNPLRLTNVNGTLYFAATDGAASGGELFILATNSRPTDLLVSSSAVPENLDPFSTVLSFTTIDADTGNTFTYGLVSGAGDTDNAGFQITGNTLQALSTFDYESKSSYSIRVRTTDQGGLWFEKVSTITVADQPEGTSGNDAFVLTYSSANVVVTRSTNNGPVTSLGTFPLSAPLTVFGFGGTDSVRIAGTIGNDVIQRTNTGVQVNGHSVTLDATESLMLAGGAGNDIYQFDADASLGLVSLDETLGGSDTLDFSLTAGNVAVNLGIATNQVINGNLTLNLKSTTTFENVTGGSGNDTLTGNSVSNILIGGTGNDVLSGSAGNDTYLFDADVNPGIDSLIDTAGIDTVSFALTSSAVDVAFSLSIPSPQAVAGGLLTLNSATAFENLTGGDGNDLLTAGSGTGILNGNSGNDTLTGGSGISTLIGGAGNDSLAGGAGNDVYLFDADSSLGSDTLNDTVGTDTISLEGTAAGVSVSLSLTATQIVNASLQLTLITAASFDNLIGGDGNDQLTGNASVNTLTGGAGDDLLSGAAGNDNYVFDADLVLGSDTISETPGAGTDTLQFGLTTTRTVSVNLGLITTQVVAAGNLSLTLTSASVLENISGGTIGNTLVGNSLVNSLNGGNGPDVLDGAGGNDVLNGGAGNDSLFGGAGNDSLTGAAGNDLLTGGLNDDTYVFDVDTSLGIDTLNESDGGNDTLDYSLTATTGITIDLAVSGSQVVTANQTLILGSGATIENVRGGSLDDIISGNSTSNSLTGNGGNDLLSGANGDDVLKGGLGNDSLNGGDGNDLLIGEAGNDVLNGGQQNDVFQFDADLAGGLGSDTVTDSDGVDVLDFALTTTLGISLLDLDVTGSQVLNGNLSLTVTAGTVFETVLGTALKDIIRGNAADNVLVGNAGNDILEGRAGRDVLIGGLGADVLNGGLDDDLLIAGRTTHDALLSRLHDIRTEWTSVSSYVNRISALRTGTGVTGVMLKAKTTVLNDVTLPDTLTGGGGDDWFFRSVDDVITDLFAPEVFEVL